MRTNRRPSPSKRPKVPVGRPLSPYELGYWIPKVPTTPGARQLLYTLGTLSQGGRAIEASVPTLAKSSNVSVRSVQTYLQELEGNGWITYEWKSRGNHDPAGHRKHKFRVDWTAVCTSAQADQDRQWQAGGALPPARPGPAPKDRSHDGPTSRADPKGATAPRAKGASSAPVSRVFQLGTGFLEREKVRKKATDGGQRKKKSFSEVGKNLVRESNSSLRAIDDTRAVSWDDEFLASEGVEFQTQTGSVFVGPRYVADWAPWVPCDGEAILLEARAFPERKGVRPPDRIALIAFLADYARKCVNGYASPHLDMILGDFPETWRNGPGCPTNGKPPADRAGSRSLGSVEARSSRGT